MNPGGPTCRPVEGDRTRTSWFNLGPSRCRPPGSTGNAKRGIIEGPGNWVVNLGLYKTVVHERRFNAEFRATFENVLNHPQFLITRIPVPRPDRHLINDVPSNGVTNVVASTDTQDNLGNSEGFNASRAIRVGLRVLF